MRPIVASVLLTCLIACGGPEPGPAEHVEEIALQLERTNASDTAMYILLDLEALAKAHPESHPSVEVIVEPHVSDERPLIRCMAILVLASLDPDDPVAQDRLQRYLLDPQEPLGLRDGVLSHPVTAGLPSREEALALLRRQAEQTSRTIGNE